MTRAAKQKAAREATAAYAASQPLFDALRIGFIRVGEQKASLSIARDIVQHLHVKTPDYNSKNERDRYERSIDCAVKAWRSATEIYAEIFEALAKATAAEVSEGRKERHGHVEFEEMARTAGEAKSAARGFVLHENIAEADGEGGEDEISEESDSEDEDEDEDEDGDEDEDEDEDEFEDSSEDFESPTDMHEEDAQPKAPKAKSEPVDTTPTNPILLHLLGKRPLPQEPTQKKPDGPLHKAPRLSEKIKYDAQGRKILWDRGAEKPNVPYGTLGSSEKKAWKAEKRRQKRVKKQAKRAAKVVEEARAKKKSTVPNGVELGPDRRRDGFQEDVSRPVFDRDYVSLNGGSMNAEPATSQLGAVQNGVQYEDVSAEVDARLKAKEEKKAREKKEKKRKRESGESVELEADGVPGEDGKGEKPKKKKAKSAGDGDVEFRTKKEKRKGREAEEDGEDEEGRKKRKKVKA